MKEPKEKAEELVEKYLEFTTGEKEGLESICYCRSDHENNAIQCALICVDEIIETYIDIDPKKKYWQSVKEHLKQM